MNLPRHTYNYIVSYDLNGSVPTHAAMDKHIAAFSTMYGRILETVWYVQTSLPLEATYNYLNRILSENDRIIVVEANDAYVRNLLIQTPSLQQAWAKAA